MAFETRSRSTLSSSGPFLAEVTNHLDPTYMGSLEVALIKGSNTSINAQGETFVVRYLSPFAGTTSVRFEGTTPSDFNSVQKSYGFWAIPPDVGAMVMVMFIDGDTNQGFWFGCVQDIFQNHMTPGIAASTQAYLTEEQKRKYGTDYVPVAEFLKKTKKLDNPSPNKFGKPVHPFADKLLEQGLLLDTIRGVTSSSARREIPSAVFGISTPGPLDTKQGAQRGKIGYDGNRQAPVSRLGGSTFVMDDGDLSGNNELVRLRTRTGHQILLHNTEDLVYIANSKGTAWIEMTSNGKIDIYAKDSISIHTENDFNFRADRDINLEAGRNLNIKVNKNMETNVTGYQILTVDDNSKIHVKGTLDQTIGDNATLTFLNNFDLNASGHIYQTSGGANHTNAGGNIHETAPAIHMNGPAASVAEVAEVPPDLPIFSLPNRSSNSSVDEWANQKFYKTEDIKSIMQRVPTHEPWEQHENTDYRKYTPAATDVTLADRTASGIPPNPSSAAGSASPSEIAQEPTNPPEVLPGTCDTTYAKAVNASSAQAGIAALKAACKNNGITSPYAIAAILGIAGGECHWKLSEESFKYSADRLLQVFPSVFKGDKALALQYAGNPNNSLPEFLYGYQTKKGKGLGNTQPGDGAAFIGRGYIQLTGRSNYTRYGVVSNPTSLNTPDVAADVSVKYFLSRCKVDQNSPAYFEAACKSVGYNTTDIKAKKKGYYECFLGQLKGGIVSSGSGGIVSDGSGNPIKTGF